MLRLETKLGIEKSSEQLCFCTVKVLKFHLYQNHALGIKVLSVQS